MAKIVVAGTVAEPLYLDHAAATTVSPALAAFWAAAAVRWHANPEAAHLAGRDCRLALAEAAERLAEAVCPGGGYQVCWAASGTDALALAVSYPEWQNTVVATTPVEHPALALALRRRGDASRIRTARLGGDGRVDLGSLAECLDARVGLVAMHQVQSETGVCQDLVGVRELMRARCPGAILLADTVQSLGKLTVPWREAEVDLALGSGHKLGAPGGAALLWHGRRLAEFGRWLSEVRGKEYRVGRPDPAMALTLAEAVCEAEAGRVARFGPMAALSRRLREGLRALVLPSGAKFAEIPVAVASPYIVSCRLVPYQGAVLVRMLAERGIMVAAGSACQAERGEASAAWLAMGVPRHEAYSALRISFWEGSTLAEVDRLLVALAEVLRQY